MTGRETNSSSETPVASRRVASSALKRILEKPEINVLIGFIVLCIGLSFASPYFMTLRNIVNVLRQFSLIAILAIGQALIIITGGIDLSVGSLVGFTACFGAWIGKSGASPLVMLVAILGIGALAGFINGSLVTRVGIAPFIATLGMMSIARGFSLLMTMGVPIHVNKTWISVFGGGYIGIVPVSVIVMLLIVVIGYIFAKNTVLGRNIYAIGNSEKAAKLSGIRVERVKVMVFTITGMLAGVCGLILVGQLEGADAFYGNGYELDVIAAAVIGGISLSGGEGNIIGIIVGAALMGVLKNAFVLLAVPGYWQTVAIGVVIIGAVSLDSLRRKRHVK